MDLAAGAKRLWVLMEHMTKEGRPKLGPVDKPVTSGPVSYALA
jgi:acyl CoA:acetate/3-ketoacid CoA transferase beta subunit